LLAVQALWFITQKICLLFFKKEIVTDGDLYRCTICRLGTCQPMSRAAALKHIRAASEHLSKLKQRNAEYSFEQSRLNSALASTAKTNAVFVEFGASAIQENLLADADNEAITDVSMDAMQDDTLSQLIGSYEWDSADFDVRSATEEAKDERAQLGRALAFFGLWDADRAAASLTTDPDPEILQFVLQENEIEPLSGVLNEAGVFSKAFLFVLAANHRNLRSAYL
jgi:hypothetical protein